MGRAIQEVDNKFDIYLKRIEDSADRRDQNTRFHMERVVERLQKLLTNQIDSDSERQRSRIEAVGLQLQLFEKTLTKTQDAAALGKSYLRSSTSSSPGSPPSSSGQRIRWTSARLCALGFVVVVTNRVPVHR